MRGRRTPEEVMQRVRELVSEGVSPTEIQDRILKEMSYELSRTPIDKEVHKQDKLRPQGRPRTSPNRARAITLKAQGLTPVEIATKLGITRQAVHRLLKVMSSSSS